MLCGFFRVAITRKSMLHTVLSVKKAAFDISSKYTYSWCTVSH